MKKLSIVGIAISGCALLMAAAGLTLSIIGVAKAE
jgi:hypothetical protein